MFPNPVISLLSRPITRVFRSYESPRIPRKTDQASKGICLAHYRSPTRAIPLSVFRPLSTVPWTIVRSRPRFLPRWSTKNSKLPFSILFERYPAEIVQRRDRRLFFHPWRWMVRVESFFPFQIKMSNMIRAIDRYRRDRDSFFVL